jgi:hypothetical protein
VIPGTCADKQAADKVARSVVAVRRTAIRIVRVIAPIAHRGGVVVVAVVVGIIVLAVDNCGTDANSN